MSINTAGLLAPQIPHVQRLVDSLYLNGFAIDLSETGTGKSYAAAAVAREMNQPIVIICPKTIIPQWEKVLKCFKLKAHLLVNYEKLIRGNTKWMKWKKLPDPMRPFQPNALTDMPDFRLPPGSLVILDEGHKCKGLNTSNSQMLVALKVQGYRVLLASATAATNPLEMKAFGFLTKLHSLYNFSDFCRLHGGKWLGRFGVMTWDNNSNEAKKAMLTLNEYLFDTRKCASRMKADDFGDLFPESHIVADVFDLGANEKRIQHVYDEMEAEIARLDERNYSAHIFAIIMKARRMAELCKVPLFVEMVEDLYDEGKSVVLFVNFDDTVDGVYKRLLKNKKFTDANIGFIVGGQTALARQKDVDAFNADTKRVLICNIAAGGIGISLHDLNGKFPRASLISPNFSAIQLVQALGRVWRQGGLTKSFQRIVYASRTIEEQACKRVQFKINSLNTLNDGDLAEGFDLFS